VKINFLLINFSIKYIKINSLDWRIGDEHPSERIMGEDLEHSQRGTYRS
jgi:hypothetical protein